MEYSFQKIERVGRKFIFELPHDRTGLTCFGVVKKSEGEQELSYRKEDHILENETFLFEIDPRKLRAIQFQDKKTGREWIDSSAEYDFGAFVHEEIQYPVWEAPIMNTIRALKYDLLEDGEKEKLPKKLLEKSIVPFEKMRRENGPVFDAIILEACNENLGDIQMHWRVYHTAPILECVLDWDKKWNNKAAAAYIPFGFNMKLGSLYIDSSGGFFEAGRFGDFGQVPGTMSFFYSTQRGVWLEDPDGGIAVATLDAPVICKDTLDWWKWCDDMEGFSGLVAGMPVNHFWRTNFAASSQGPLQFRYRIGMPGNEGLESAENALVKMEELPALGWV